MSGVQIVRSVELPLALPLIFGGIRTSTVNVIATATIAPLVGVLTLGDPIISGTVYGRAGQIGASIMVAALAIAAEVACSRRPAGGHAHRRQARTGRSAFPPRNPQEEDPDRPMKPSLRLLMLVLACRPVRRRLRRRRRREPPSTPVTGVAGRLRRQDHRERRQRQGPADHRLEELHRAEGARRDLRAGPRGRRLHGQQGPQPRRREDRARGRQVRPDLRLPGVHRHGAAVVLRQAGRRAAQGPAGRLRGGQEGLRGRRPDRVPADAVHVLQRGRGDRRRRPTSSA